MQTKTKKCPTCAGKGTVADQSSIAEGLVKIREKAGVPSLQVAARLNIGKSTLHALEHGQGTWTKERIDDYKKAVAFLKDNPPARKPRKDAKPAK